MAWETFTQAAYGKYFSIVGGRLAVEGDDSMKVRRNDKDYEVVEMVIQGAEILLKI